MVPIDVSLAEVGAVAEDVASFGATVVMPLDISSSAVDPFSVDDCRNVVEMIPVLASFAMVIIDAVELSIGVVVSIPDVVVGSISKEVNMT